MNKTERQRLQIAEMVFEGNVPHHFIEKLALLTEAENNFREAKEGDFLEPSDHHRVWRLKAVLFDLLCSGGNDDI